MSGFVNMVQIPEVTKNQLLEYLKDDDKEAWNVKPMVVGLTSYCDKVISAPVLSQLLDALGWQGGTVADALAEVRRLKTERTQIGWAYEWKDGTWDLSTEPMCGALRPLYIVRSDPVVHDPEPLPKPLGQGVAALLPESLEPKTWVCSKCVCVWPDKYSVCLKCNHVANG